ncbi:hypothetical protein [Pseudopedobacter beijingensis]|uniref:Lipoprotein n=1 Tax=Pseudopedobacter beijingensis TaxID=1207056 RepID=A0ABW4I944_9SPHI
MFRVTLFFTATLLLFGCKKEDAPKRDLGFDYFPLKEKMVWIYDVDSTFYDKFTGKSTNYRFQLKDSITSSFLNTVGDPVYRVERYKKNENEQLWIYQKNFTRSIHLRSGEETSDNLTHIKIIFPPEIYASWNGNSRNTLDKQIYRIDNIEQGRQIGNQQYDVVDVLQIDDFNLIDEEYTLETYAKQIGLVKKEDRQIEKNIQSGIIIHGYIYTMTLNEHR